VDNLRIATEEAFALPELITLWRKTLDEGTCDDPGFLSLPGFYITNSAERPVAILSRLQDLGQRRLADMTLLALAACRRPANGEQVPCTGIRWLAWRG
jgi:hypothetical protein